MLSWTPVCWGECFLFPDMCLSQLKGLLPAILVSGYFISLIWIETCFYTLEIVFFFFFRNRRGYHLALRFLTSVELFVISCLVKRYTVNIVFSYSSSRFHFEHYTQDNTNLSLTVLEAVISVLPWPRLTWWKLHSHQLHDPFFSTTICIRNSIHYTFPLSLWPSLIW